MKSIILSIIFDSILVIDVNIDLDSISFV